MTIPQHATSGVVEHESAQVDCDTHQQTAVISAIERRDVEPPLRFVLWCSLRGIGHCDEACLRPAQRGDDAQRRRAVASDLRPEVSTALRGEASTGRNR
ncbi:MAG: hypothetical protein ABI629_01950 [bacterium]